MADGEYRVFLSAVSSEFGSARNALTDDFGARDVLVRVQEQFLPDKQPHTLLAALDDYISGCTTVICLIGKRSGACPTPEEAAPFAQVLPDGVTQASYTQWEYFLARHHGKECLLYLAADTHQPDEPSPATDLPDLQRDFVERIRRSHLHYERFDTVDRLGRLVGRQRWPERVARPGAPARKLIVLPYASIGPLFKGRDAFLRALGDSLTRGNAAALYGLGGVGKTRAAVEYAWTHRARYTAVFLLQAGTAAALQSSLAGLLTPLLLSDKAPPQEAERAEIALGWLNANPGWLLILDNLDTQEALDTASGLMGRLDGGHVLLTSRLERFPRGVPRLALDVLSPEAAAAFLLEATPGRSEAADDQARAATLAEELGGLALALEMAAATIDTRHLDFSRYRALWREHRQRVIGWARPEIDGYSQAMAETWQTSVRQLTAPGRALLERLAFLAPDPVPEFLLDVPVPGAAAEDARAALDDLAAYSLATRDPEGRAFLVHRLVQDVTRRGLEVAGTATPRLTEALGWVDAAFAGQPDDVRTWPRLDPLAQHADAVAAYADAADIADPTGQLMGALGVLFSGKALHDREEPLKRRALAIGEASLANNHPEIATRLNNLAYLLQATNRLGEAEPLLRRALAIDEASYGDDHPSVARDLNNLAALLQATNRLGEAEPLMRRALAITEASLGKDHPDVAISLNNLAQLLQDTNRLGEAEPLLRRALAIDEASLGKDHPSVATALNNLAQLLQDTNRLGEAEPLMRRVIDIFEASFGKDHPNVATARNNLALLLHATNRLGEAEPLYRRALAITEASLGNDHPTVAIRLNNLARLLQATNRLGEAEPLMRRHLVIFLAFQRDTGHAHPHRDAAIGNYAALLAAMGRSEPEIVAAIATVFREVGLDHV
jgi:tetratricopeptide (TPR) repeat protein